MSGELRNSKQSNGANVQWGEEVFCDVRKVEGTGSASE